jgi:hypothetical protein
MAMLGGWHLIGYQPGRYPTHQPIMAEWKRALALVALVVQNL